MKGKQQIILPDNWTEVSVYQFQELYSIDDNDAYRTEIILKILTGAPLDLITSMDVESRNKAVGLLSWANVYPDDTYYKTEITIGEETFRIINLPDLSLGDWINLDNYLKKPIENLHHTLSILYGCKDSKLFLNAKVGEVYQALVFFSHIAINLIRTIPHYATAELDKILKNLEGKTQ